MILDDERRNEAKFGAKKMKRPKNEKVKGKRRGRGRIKIGSNLEFFLFPCAGQESRI